MQKRQMGRILSIVLLATLCISACKCGQKRVPGQAPTPTQAPVQVLAPAAVQTQSTTQPQASLTKPVINERKVWASRVVAKYPEVAWLAKAQVRSTEEGHATAENSFSQQIYNEKFVEFDRALMSLYCLQLILDGSDQSYQEFTAAQPENVRLSKESFQKLHEQGKSLLTSNYQGLSSVQMQQAMETALVLGEMGKSEKGRSIFKGREVTALDSNDFYAQALEVLKSHTHMCRSFARLSPPAKQLLPKVANLINYGQVLQLEGGPSLFRKLKTSNLVTTDPTALSFDLFVQTCHIAATLGHVNNTSSLIYTEQTYQAMQAVANACRILSDPTKTELDAYQAYLSFRASGLGLNPSDQNDRVLTRIAAMLRLFTPEEGTILKNSILQLNPQDQQRILSQFDISFAEELGRTPTDMPAVLANLSNNTKSGSIATENLRKAVTYGLPFIAKVLQQQQQQILQHLADPQIPLNFNTIAGVAKNSPRLLKTNRFQITSDGTVTLE